MPIFSFPVEIMVGTEPLSSPPQAQNFWDLITPKVQVKLHILSEISKFALLHVAGP